MLPPVTAAYLSTNLSLVDHFFSTNITTAPINIAQGDGASFNCVVESPVAEGNDLLLFTWRFSPNVTVQTFEPRVVYRFQEAGDFRVSVAASNIVSEVISNVIRVTVRDTLLTK